MGEVWKERREVGCSRTGLWRERREVVRGLAYRRGRRLVVRGLLMAGEGLANEGLIN